MAEELSESYANYMRVDFAKELSSVEEAIEELTRKLEEFQGIQEMVRGESMHCLGKTVPEIYTYSREMQKLFQRIDKLESFVNHVKQELDVMESHLEEAESVVGAESSLKTILKPLFFKKSDSSSGGGKKTPKTPSYEAPKIFCTSDFFKHEEKPLVEKSSDTDET